MKIAASIPTSLGGGKHGHIGVILPEDEYVKISQDGKKISIPEHPGHYPTTVSSIAATRAKQEAMLKAKIIEYKICTGVICAIKEKIVESVDSEWLEEKEDKILEFQNITIIEMLEHLESLRGEIDYINIQEMKKEHDAPYDTSEHIITHFLKVKKAVKQLH